MTKQQQALESVLPKFQKTREGGKAYRTMDEDFGNPETYVVTLKWDERQLVESTLNAAIARLQEGE